MHYLLHKIHTFTYPNALTELLKKAKNAAKHSATVGTYDKDNFTTNINKDKCNAFLVDYELSDVSNILKYCVDLVKNIYKVNVLETNIEFLCYKDGSQYWPHIDGQYAKGNLMKRSHLNRDVTCIVYLNDDYTGGELNFKIFNQTYKPKANDVICFLGSYRYIHSVSPVTGERYALVFWMHTDPHMFDDEYVYDTKELQTIIDSSRPLGQE